MPKSRKKHGGADEGGEGEAGSPRVWGRREAGQRRLQVVWMWGAGVRQGSSSGSGPRDRMGGVSSTEWSTEVGLGKSKFRFGHGTFEMLIKHSKENTNLADGL